MVGEKQTAKRIEFSRKRCSFKQPLESRVRRSLIQDYVIGLDQLGWRCADADGVVLKSLGNEQSVVSSLPFTAQGKVDALGTNIGPRQDNQENQRDRVK